MRDFAANPHDEFFQARMAEAPKQEHDIYWDAFWELNGERFYAEGPIPPSVMWQYAREHDWHISEQRAFVHIMRCMDNALMSIRAEKIKAAK